MSSNANATETAASTKMALDSRAGTETDASKSLNTCDETKLTKCYNKNDEEISASLHFVNSNGETKDYTNLPKQVWKAPPKGKAYSGHSFSGTSRVPEGLVDTYHDENGRGWMYFREK
ncbi:uncharacterized protein IL334_004610 [Kwoniella shivajii]|uniref:Uncharacterized protein n=1 Tax=Kwoniella shivajii TaxID=564305 RepID=A0ABZ1D0Z3_9TREE|nr:hypothetical protein IL334_004610 [Kwoniella shivajii]